MDYGFQVVLLQVVNSCLIRHVTLKCNIIIQFGKPTQQNKDNSFSGIDLSEESFYSNDTFHSMEGIDHYVGGNIFDLA